MNTWDIAKLLIDNCGSPSQVEQVLVVLRNPDHVNRLRGMLMAFAEEKTTVAQEKQQARSSVDPKDSTEKTDELASSMPLVVSMNSTSESIAAQMELILRNLGMTNKQSEEWITDNFGIGLGVGKGSLRAYLVKVLDSADLGLKNRIFAATQRLGSGEPSSDIKEYWDAFDKHYSSVE